ncbi:MAG: NUDIX domain-containing protein [Anaeroplasmataceae bacterium]|nr:NUDIX domain-containing protein [Anaeroplasmataceae bacterium]
MEYCPECGTKLEKKEIENEGLIPYCSKCKTLHFPHFNTAVSMVITTKDMDRALLIEQYGKKKYILVAGYVNKGEDAETAAKREILEEVGLQTIQLIFQRTAYYEKSNTLMINFIAVVEDERVQPNDEVDSYAWFSLEEAKHQIAKGSLAEEFYELFYNRVKANEV